MALNPGFSFPEPPVFGGSPLWGVGAVSLSVPSSFFAERSPWWTPCDQIGLRCQARRHLFEPEETEAHEAREVPPAGGGYCCGGQNRFGIPFWLVVAPPILEPTLVGLGCSLGGNRDFDPWPYVSGQGINQCLENEPVFRGLVLGGRFTFGYHSNCSQLWC